MTIKSYFTIIRRAAAWAPLFALQLVSVAAFGAENSDTEGIEFFEKKIRPVLADKCYQCHSADAEKIQGGLVLDTGEGIRVGGNSGPAVVPPADTQSGDAAR